MVETVLIIVKLFSFFSVHLRGYEGDTYICMCVHIRDLCYNSEVMSNFDVSVLIIRIFQKKKYEKNIFFATKYFNKI